MKESLLEVKDLVKEYPIKGKLGRESKRVRAINGVNLSVHKGETLGIVGESGCGKSTTGRCILRLVDPTSGQILFEGKDITKLKSHEMQQVRKGMQIVFQDPFSSLNPRKRIKQILLDPLIVHGIGTQEERIKQVEEMIEVVGLRKEHLQRFPHEFSGGQRQRIGIARALILKPKLIIADEPVSALDVSVQAQILNLMKDLQEKYGLTYLFISHDLSVIRHISNRIAVMYLGKIVEIADKENLYQTPFHPYTKALLSAVPIPNPEIQRERILLEGDLPSPSNPPKGCSFHPRCPHRSELCENSQPALREIGQGHLVACHFAEELAEKVGKGVPHANY